MEHEGKILINDPRPVAEWLPLYGTDPYYSSRRIRRITERAYNKASYMCYMYSK